MVKMQSQGETVKTIRPYVNIKGDSSNFLRNRSDIQQVSKYVDFTNPSACDWYESLVQKLIGELPIKRIHLYSPNIDNMKAFNESVPSLYYRNWLATMERIGSTTSYYSFKTQQFPTILVTHPKGDDNILGKIISTALSLSLGGYSFFSSTVNRHIHSTEELYIRFLQASALLPAIAFVDLASTLPSEKKVIARKFIQLHREHAPLIIELARKRVQDGTPIIRPMWYAAPNNERTYRIADQFMLGEDIVVAPVLVIGVRERVVYLPPGSWLDQHGNQHSGSSEIKVKAPLEELPYFKRKK